MKRLHSHPRRDRLRFLLSTAALALVALLPALVGCDTRDADMYYQPRAGPYDSSEFYEDGTSARPIVPGTVGRTDVANRYYKAAQPWFNEPSREEVAARNEGFPADFPTGGPELAAVLARGQERFNIYCAVCHGYNGLGTGIIVQAGSPSRRPSSCWTRTR